MERARVQRDAVVQQVRTLFTLGAIDGMTDGRLLERFTTCADESAESAFAALVERHGPMVLRVCRSVLHDRHDAEDAFQATFLVMVRRARSLWVRDSLGPWLYQVAHRTATRARTMETQRRRRERKAALGLATEFRERAPDDLDEALHEEIARLPERYRAAVVVCLLEGLPNEQAARRLGWPVGTVQSRLARGRERLKRSLTRRGLAPSIAVTATALPPTLAEATLQSALQYAAPGSQAAAISSSILALTEGVLRMMTLAKLKTGLLAFAMVGSLGLATVAVPRSIGAAGQEPSSAPVPPAPSMKLALKPMASEARTEMILKDESTVLIRVKHEMERAVGVARGTIIKSTPTETIILTCGHAFKSESGSAAVKPTFIKVTYRRQLRDYDEAGMFMLPHSAEQSDAELIDCDTRRDLALVRIRPGEVLPVSLIVPRGWDPKPGMKMTTIQGDSGEDFAECSVLGVREGLKDNPDYEAIECDLAPAQGSSGVGLFATRSGGGPSLLAGVANYSDPKNKTGLYASPKSIYSILDKNGLSSLYHTEDQGLSPAPTPDLALQRSGEVIESTEPKEVKEARAMPPVQEPAPQAPVDTAKNTATANPFEATVRITIKGEKPITALGTIISSSPDESIVLTCSQIFKLDPDEGPIEPSKFPRKIRVVEHDLARSKDDSSLSILIRDGEAIDYDFARGVALIRIRPGLKTPAARLVPPGWRITNTEMPLRMDGFGLRYAAGTSSQSKVVSPLVQGRIDGVDYQGIELSAAPKQYSMGGGFFVAGRNGDVRNYSLAGVCNYADSKKNTGLFASPEMIYHILAQNGLSHLADASSPALSLAPEPDFQVLSPGSRDSINRTSASTDEDRLRKVEQRVDAIDGKIDEILRLLKP